MPANTYTLGHYLVAFLDVLDQRNKFEGLHLPKNAEEEASVAKVLAQTAGFVVGLRETFKKQFDIFENAISITIHAGASSRPKFIGFSDSFVTSVSLRPHEHYDLSVFVNIFSALSAASVVMLTSLASRHPLRGGIEVGLGTEIDDDEIYGTALERAYLLECKTAQYPRIVIGDGLWTYLNSVLAEFANDNTPKAKAIVGITHKLVQFIGSDKDGKRILDYLGAVIVEHSGGGHRETMIQPAYQFVLDEQKRMRQEGKTELVARYASFRAYFESRLPLWGMLASTL